MNQEKKIKYATFGSIFSALLAGSCCILPVLAVGLGLGGGAFAFSQFLGEYHWLFVGMAFLLIGWSFWSVFLRKCEGSCAPGKLRKASIIGSFMFILIFAFYPQVLIGGNDSHIESGDEIAFHVTGMTCDGCARGIEASLRSQKGIKSCFVSFKEETMKCALMKNQNTKQVISWIKEIGYEASIVKAAGAR